MLCLRVSRNGRVLTQAGVSRGSLFTCVEWWNPEGDVDVARLAERAVVPGLSMAIRGIQRRVDMTWCRNRRLRLGDVITIQVVRGTRQTPVQKRALPKRKHSLTGETPRCSFCWRLRGDREVDVPSVAGSRDGTTIMCHQCVFLAAAIVEARGRAALHMDVVRNDKCSFCQRRSRRLIGARDSRVCGRCVVRLARHF